MEEIKNTLDDLENNIQDQIEFKHWKEIARVRIPSRAFILFLSSLFQNHYNHTIEQARFLFFFI